MSTQSKSKEKYPLSQETAEAVLDKLIEYYEIDLDDLPIESKSGIEAVMKKMVKFIRMGRLEIKTEDGIQCIQTLRNSETTLTYGELTGKAKTAMGTKEMNDTHGRLFALLGVLCGSGEAVILKLKGPDLSLAECLGGLFLLV